jgi:hypothetical protein
MVARNGDDSQTKYFATISLLIYLMISTLKSNFEPQTSNIEPTLNLKP